MSLVSETVKADDEGEEEEEEQRYCVCRGTYGNKFMIGCDNCEEWFHGSCISINSDQAKYVDKYYCPFCKEKDPSLKTVFKPKVKDKDRDKHREKRHKEKLKRREEKRKREEKREEKRGRHTLDSDSDDNVTAKKAKPELSFKKKSETRDLMMKEEMKKIKKHKEEKGGKDELRMKNREEKINKEELRAKHKEEKSSKEDFKVKHKEEKVNKEELKAKHKDREELKVKPAEELKSRPPQTEILSKTKPEEPSKFKLPKETESLKSKTVKIKDEKDRPAVSSSQSEEQVVKKKKVEELKPKTEEIKTKRDEEKKSKADEPMHPTKLSKATPPSKPSKATPPSKPAKLMPSPKPSKATPPAPSKPSKPSDSEDEDADFDDFLSALSKQSKPKAPVISSSENEDVDVGMDDMMVETTKKPTKSAVKEPPVKSSKTTSNQGRKKVLKKKGRPKKLTGTKNVVVGSQNDKESSEEEERQCLGPGCCNSARHRSRYCCDECGVKLAVKRIKTFLPERKEEMSRGGTAKRFDQEQIDDLEKQQTVAHQKILELQNQRLVIMNLIKNAKATILDNNSEEDISEDEVPADNEEVDCVICGMACTDKNAVRHMERCYNKFESKLGLGSTVKCHVTWESPVCDAYDRQQGTYCKKLRVLCPDHNKEKEEHDGICGCPLDLSDISETSTVCHKAKRACNKHTSWEKLRLAEIDMERVLQDLKLEDSFEEMRKVKYRMAYRTNLLQILLNGTICHGNEAQSSVT